MPLGSKRLVVVKTSPEFTPSSASVADELLSDVPSAKLIAMLSTEPEILKFAYTHSLAYLTVLVSLK